MALRYPQQGFPLYGHPQWPEDVKPEYTDDEDDDEDSILDDKVLDPASPSELTGAHDNRRHSMIKLEDEFSVAAHTWQDRPQGHMSQMRHYSHPNVPMISPPAHQAGRIGESHYASTYTTSQPWQMAPHSESSTPTPMYVGVPDGFGQPVQYPNAPVAYPQYHPNPASAVSMSPQSSQGGWGSTASSDTTEPRSDLRSPRFRPMSPMTVLRSDGIRKKNARFEIPKERNLANIDALIMQSTDEVEKKELKQQKRLLRNRQAALDSRQRKKTHTEKLEQEKKMFTSQKSELEEALTHVENTLNMEREQWMQQRQQYENYIQTLQYERDEAIRTKTLETAELRRMNNVLKDCVKDLEREQNARGFNTTGSDTFGGDFSNFGNLDLEDNWEDEFSLINNEDLKMEGEESPRREATPRPSTVTDSKSVMGAKPDTGFSWNTFYMCLLFGAFIASNSKDTKGASNTAPTLPPTIPALSEDYRAEAGNVLKAVLASAPESNPELLPSNPSAPNANTGLPTTITGSEFSRLTNQHGSLATSSLEALHTTLTTPTRQQRVAAAFSLSAASYNHINNPDPDGSYEDDEVVEVKPTRLQQLYAAMQAERDGIDRMTGMSGKARERSVLLDRVPEKVLRDFREMVGLNDALSRDQHHHQHQHQPPQQGRPTNRN